MRSVNTFLNEGCFYSPSDQKVRYSPGEITEFQESALSLSSLPGSASGQSTRLGVFQFSCPFLMLQYSKRVAQGRILFPTLCCYNDILAKQLGSLREVEQPLMGIMILLRGILCCWLKGLAGAAREHHNHITAKAVEKGPGA